MGDTGLQNLMTLLETPELPELGPGPRSGIQTEAALGQKLQDIFAKSKAPTRNQELIRALILLWHDHLDPAHVIAQDIETADGSFVHGIMHRREPDYGNAKYWFRRVGKHSALTRMAERAEGALRADDATDVKNQVIRNSEWDSFGFVDACEQAARKKASRAKNDLLRQLQKIETEALLEHLWG